MTGSQAWSQSGKEEHARGEGEYKAAQAKGYVEGATDRVGGYKDSVVGAVTGDKSQQAAGRSDVGRPQFLVADEHRRECQERERPGATGSQQALNSVAVDFGRSRVLYVSHV